MSSAERPRILLGRGPRACERILQETLTRELRELGIEVLENPLYLLVPSHSLRNHTLELLVRQRRGMAGVGCFTLRGLAREILERCGESPPQGSWMLPVLVRRAAQQHPPLRSCLGHLHDGYANLVSTVSDLLEAGLEPAHASAFDEVLAEEGRLVASVAAVQRARSLIQVATQIREEMDALGLGHASSLLQRATDLLRTQPDLDLSSSGFHIFGFADATGVATDLIEAVLLRFGGTVYLDHAPDPTDPTTEDPSFEFSRRFATRLTDLGQLGQEATAASEPPEIDLIAALGGQAEVRDIGWRIRRLIDDGVQPERIGIVARRLEPYRSALRTHLSRLGIPFSALSTTGPLLPRGRRIRALLEILNQRQRVRLERWLDARTDDVSDVLDFDLRLAMFGLGVSRLDELAGLHLEEILRRETYALPVRLGFSGDSDEAGVRLPRRHVRTVDLRRTRDQAADICQLFETWEGRQAWPAHRKHFDRLLSLLGWSAPDPPLTDVQNSMDQLARGVPGDLELGLEEFAQVLSYTLGGLGSERLGGLGGGVQILDVTEARGRTFESLFLLGMNKGIFPRTIREDPALPDSLRRVLGREGHGVLPDLPLKRAGFAEERFLFAQLCAASPHLTLSWQVADDDNREVTTSPLVERLLWTRDPTRVSSPQTLSPVADSDSHPRTAFESAIRAALGGSTRQIKAALAAAQPVDLSISPKALAESRLGVAAEFDRPAGEDSRLGPYFGFVGMATDPAEPRLAHRLYVTTLERFAACPWQTFLERLLRLEALPDPVEVLPGLDPILIGQLVHRVLERLVEERIQEAPATLEEARAADPLEIPWPEQGALQRIVRRQATAISRAQGIAWEGFADVLAQVALPFLDQARAHLWEDPEVMGPVAVEMEGSLSVAAGPTDRLVHFKVDRVDNSAGRLLLSDYKTGRRGVSDAKTAKTRDKHLVAEIRKGRLLQAAAYARAAGSSGDLGQYVFVHPVFAGPEDARIVTVTADNEGAQNALVGAVDTLIAAWFSGCFFPRLIEPDMDKEPAACDYCGVAEACLRGDSGARGRLRDWTAGRRPETQEEKSFLDAWLLASAKEPQP